VSRQSKRTTIWMHKVLCPCDEGYIVDHKNRNTLDNRKKNLRPATDSQNGANSKRSKSNTSGLKGVTWQKKANKWQAQVMVNRKHLYLGLFDDKFEAAKAYDSKAREVWGDFAATNRMLGLLN